MVYLRVYIPTRVPPWVYLRVYIPTRVFLRGEQWYIPTRVPP